MVTSSKSFEHLLTQRQVRKSEEESNRRNSQEKSMGIMEKAEIKIMKNRKHIRKLRILQQNATIKHQNFIDESIKKERIGASRSDSL